MQYVTEEVAREIERAVEVITSDEKGFLREAALQYIKENAPTDKVEGEKYIFTGDETIAPEGERHYPARGTTGTLTRNDRTESPLFQWESAPPDFPGGEVYNDMRFVRRISALTAPEKPKPEPVKLYCVKSYKPGEWLTRGKTYDVADGRITYDDGWATEWTAKNKIEDGREINPVLGHYCFPLVSRPAKVGEWVLLTEEPLVNEADHCDSSFAVDYHKGDLVKITHFGIMPSVRAKIGGQYSGFRDHEYLVLDGYDGRYEEQEQPKPNAALTERIKHLETENRLLEAENAKLCAKIAAIRKAVESEE